MPQVLQAFSYMGLHLAPEKCEFHQQSVKYLGSITTTEGVAPDPAKIATIQERGTPKCLIPCAKDVRHFLGFANFYRRFIKGFSRIITPLTRLTGDDPFDWSPDCAIALATLESAFTSAPILRHFDHDSEIVVETDASDFVSAGVLSQYDDDVITRHYPTLELLSASGRTIFVEDMIRKYEHVVQRMIQNIETHDYWDLHRNNVNS